MNLAVADLLVAVGMLGVTSYGMSTSDTKLNTVMSVIIVLVLILGVVSSIFYVVSLQIFILVQGYFLWGIGGKT